MELTNSSNTSVNIGRDQNRVLVGTDKLQDSQSSFADVLMCERTILLC